MNGTWICRCLLKPECCQGMDLSVWHAAHTWNVLDRKHPEGSLRFTDMPTSIDPVALGYFLVALGSIIVGISVPSCQIRRGLFFFVILTMLARAVVGPPQKDLSTHMVAHAHESTHGLCAHNEQVPPPDCSMHDV
jgi:hypothetical protein